MSIQKRLNQILKEKNVVRHRVATSYNSEYLISYTEKEIAEISKCKKNIVYTINKYVKILHTEKGSMELFETYDFQDEVVNKFLEKYFIVTLKSRQTGLSTITRALILLLAIFYPNFNVGVLSITSREATYYLQVLRSMLDELPLFLRPKIVIDNAQHLAFDNGSSIRTSTTTDNTFRSFAFNMLIIDEAAFIKNIGITFASMWPTLSKAFSSASGRPYGIIIVSTPCGCGNFYHKTWEMAKKKLNNFVPIEVHWSRVPEYDQTWYEEQCKALGYDKTMIAQELDLSFNKSGLTFFPDEFLDKVKGQIPIKRVTGIELIGGDSHGELWIWEKPIEDTLYILGIDVATKFGYEFSCIEVIDINTGNQVAEYLGKIDTVDLAKLTLEIAHLYNGAILGIERNFGWSLIDLCYKSGYGKIYSDKLDQERRDKAKKKKSFQTGKRKVGMKSKPLSSMEKLGIWVSAVNRYEILNILYRAVRQYEVNPDIFRSDRSIIEAKSFVWKSDTRPEHDDDSNDDTLFGLAYAWYVKSRLTGENLEKILSTEQSSGVIKFDGGNTGKGLLEIFFGDEDDENQDEEIDKMTESAIEKLDSQMIRPQSIRKRKPGRHGKHKEDIFNEKVVKRASNLFDNLF